MSWETYELMFDLRVWAIIIFVVVNVTIGWRAEGKRRREAQAKVDARNARAAAVKRSEAKRQAWAAHSESLRLLAEDEAAAEADTDEWNERDDLAARVARLQPQDDGCPF